MGIMGIMKTNNNIKSIWSQTLEFNNCKIEISFCPNTRIQSIVKSGPNIHKGLLLQLSSPPSPIKSKVLHTNTFYDKEVGSRDYLEYYLNTNKHKHKH